MRPEARIAARRASTKRRRASTSAAIRRASQTSLADPARFTVLPEHDPEPHTLSQIFRRSVAETRMTGRSDETPHASKVDARPSGQDFTRILFSNAAPAHQVQFR